MTYRPDVSYICRHGVKSSRFKLFAVCRSKVDFWRCTLFSVKNHVQLSARIHNFTESESNC